MNCICQQSLLKCNSIRHQSSKHLTGMEYKCICVGHGRFFQYYKQYITHGKLTKNVFYTNFAIGVCVTKHALQFCNNVSGSNAVEFSSTITATCKYYMETRTTFVYCTLIHIMLIGRYSAGICMQVNKLKKGKQTEQLKKKNRLVFILPCTHIPLKRKLN